MSKDSPTTQSDNAVTHHSQSNNRNDLTNKMVSQINGEQSASTQANHAPKSTASPNNSPTKSSPTKSKNKKKNDAKRRSANIKRQQQQQQQSQAESATEPTSRSDKTKQDLEPVGDSLEKYKHLKDNPPSSIRASSTPSSSSTKLNTKHSQVRLPDSANMTSQAGNMGQQVIEPIAPLPSDQKGAQSVDLTQTSTNSNNVSADENGHHTRSSADTNSWRRKQRENRELREQLKLKDTQLQSLADKFKQQISKTKELESSLISTTRTCSQFEKLLQAELTNRSKLEAENHALNQTVDRLRHQISAHEKERSANNELIRVLNATLMERETEVSILKLKMTRMQTNSSASMSQFNPPSNPSLVRQDPCKAFTAAGRSNSEFSRNSTTRSTMMADAISARSSTSHLQHQHQYLDDRDAQVWANVPEELTPSKRPVLLERNLPQLYEQCHNIHSGNLSSPLRNQSSTPLTRDRRYKTLPRSMKSPVDHREDDLDSAQAQQPADVSVETKEFRASPVKQPSHCLVTNLDESNTTSLGNRSLTEVSGNHDDESKSKLLNETPGLPSTPKSETLETSRLNGSQEDKNNENVNHYSSINEPEPLASNSNRSGSQAGSITLEKTDPPPNLARKSPSTPVRLTTGLRKILGKFKRSDSSSNESQSKTDLRSQPSTPQTGAFQRGATRSTLVGPPSTFRAQMSPLKAMDFQTDKPFADWDTNMLVEWLTMIGLSMYANQCRRWVECGAHIMNATPAEVDKGLGITNHLHRKKLRLAISELNGDCDKVTKAAAKLDYLWVARWLDDIGVPQYKEAFINARVDGRVLNYLTVEDLVSLGVKSLLHHSSIRCGIKVLRSINFNLQLLKRRATADEIEQMNPTRESMDAQTEGLVADKTTNVQQVKVCDELEVPLWTCHRVMEWLRMIDCAEFAPNLRGSGVHGGLIMYEDGFNIDTMSTLLSIPSNHTLLRRHLSTFFENLIGKELAQRKKQYKELSSNQQLNPTSEIKYPKKPLWFTRLKSSKVGQDGMDEYLCPMYPVEPQIIKSPTRKSEASRREVSNLPRIPESINV